MNPATTDDQELFSRMVALAPFGAGMAPDVKPYATDAVPPINARGGRGGEGWRAVYSATVMKEWTNIVGAMHGAAAGWLVDTCTTAALVSLSTPTFWGPPMIGGVSLTLDMSYFNPAPEGIKLRIVVTVERLSPTLANTRCDISEWETGRRICSGTHCKTWRPGPKEGAREAKI